MSGSRNTGTAEAVNNVNFAFDFGTGQNQDAMNAGYAPPDHTNLYGAVWFDKDYSGIYDENTGLAGFKVALSQFYFVPEYNASDHQRFEDADGNFFYYADGKLHLEQSVKGNIIVGPGSDGPETVYLVRAGRAYKLQDLVDAGSVSLFASGTWVLNKNFAGNGGQYRSASVSFDGNAPDGVMVEGTTAAIDGTNGATVALPDCGFTAAGYHFVGWNTAADGSGDAYNVGSDFVLNEAGSVLYAQWEADEIGRASCRERV